MPSFAPLEVVFWTCFGLVAFAYLGYPVLIFALSRLFGRPPVPPAAAGDAELPPVSVLVAAYNEELDIRARVENLLALDYPGDRIQVVIASDGSTDRTNAIVEEYAGRGVRLLAFPRNRGKVAVLNDALKHLTGDVVILSDANTHMAADAARRLAGWFADPAVGVVCGRLVLSDPRTGRNVDGLYWKYETFLKKCESRLGALLGSNGAIYAIRRGLFPHVRPGTLIDDFVIPLDAKRRSGCRVVYDTRAVACEETAPTILAEFRRRVRIGAGGFQSIRLLWRLLSPAHGWVAVTFLCHKLLRWACPFLLAGMAAANVLLRHDPRYAALLWGQCGFYALSVAGNFLPARPRFLRFLRLPTMFATMNLALLLGFFKWLRGTDGTWVRTDRTGDEPPVNTLDLQTAGAK